MNHYLILKLRNASIDCDQRGLENLAALLDEAIREIEKLSMLARGRATIDRAAKRTEFETNCEALPEGVSWGDAPIYYKRSTFRRGGWTTFNIRDVDADEVERRLCAPIASALPAQDKRSK